MVLVGHSLGGDVAVEAAHLLEGRVLGVVTISSYRTLGQSRSEQADADWLAPFSTDFASAMDDLTRRNFGASADPSMVEATVRRMVAANPGMVVPVLQSKMSNEPALLGLLDQLDVPVFAVNPDFKSNDEEALRRHGMTLRVVEGVGHYTMMEDPVAFNQVLEQVLLELA